MTTTEPSLAIEIAAAARERGASAVDAPVSGGDVGARNAALSIMIGGEPDDVARARPLFELLGKNIVHQGGPGAGQHTKMCNQIVIAGTMIGVCESLVYGTRAGLDLETMLTSIKSGAAGCWTLENLAPRVIKRNFDPGFIVEHFLKDMGIALEEARRMKLSLPGLALVHQLYVAVQAQGHGRGGTQALVLALEHMSGGNRAPRAPRSAEAALRAGGACRAVAPAMTRAGAKAGVPLVEQTILESERSRHRRAAVACWIVEIVQ